MPYIPFTFAGLLVEIFDSIIITAIFLAIINIVILTEEIAAIVVEKVNAAFTEGFGGSWHFNRENKLESLFLAPQRNDIEALLNSLSQVYLFEFELHDASLDLSKVKNVVDDR